MDATAPLQALTSVLSLRAGAATFFSALLSAAAASMINTLAGNVAAVLLLAYAMLWLFAVGSGFVLVGLRNLRRMRE